MQLPSVFGNEQTSSGFPIWMPTVLSVPAGAKPFQMLYSSTMPPWRVHRRFRAFSLADDTVETAACAVVVSANNTVLAITSIREMMGISILMLLVFI